MKFRQCFAAAALVIAAGSSAGRSEPVAVNGGEGQGLVVAHQGRCFLVLPKHVAGPFRTVSVGTTAPVTTVDATLMPHRSGYDLAVAEVDATLAPRCVEPWSSLSLDVAELIAPGTAAILTRVTSAGELASQPMTITGSDLTTIDATADGGGDVFKGLSGGVLRVRGAIVGIAIEAFDQKDGEITRPAARFIRIDQIRSELQRPLDGQVRTARAEAQSREQAQAISTARVEIERAQRAAFERDPALAAALALKALERVRPTDDIALKSRAAKLLYTEMIKFQPPAIDIPLPIPTGGIEGNDARSERSFTASWDGYRHTVSNDRRHIVAFDVRDSSKTSQIVAPETIEDLKFSFDGESLLLRTRARHWRLVLFRDGETWQDYGPVAEKSYETDFSPSGTLVTDVSGAKQIVFRGQDGRPVGKPLTVPAKASIGYWSEDETHFAAMLENKEFYLWRMPGAKQLGKWKVNEYSNAVFSDDGSKLLIDQSGGMGGAPLVFDLRTLKNGPPLARFDRDKTKNTRFLDREGKFAASLAPDNTISVWDVRTGAVVRALSGAPAPIYWISTAGQGDLLVAPMQGKGVMVWRWTTGETIGHIGETWDPAFSLHPLGERPIGLVLRGDRLQSVYLSQPLIRLPGLKSSFVNLVVSKDRTRIATSTDEETILWNAETGAIVKDLHVKLQGAASRAALAFSADGATLLVGPTSESGGPVRVIKASDGALLKSLPGPSAPVTKLLFSKEFDTGFYSFGAGEFFIGDTSGHLEFRGNLMPKGAQAFTEVRLGAQDVRARLAYYNHTGEVSVAEFTARKAVKIGSFSSGSEYVNDIILDKAGDTVVSANGKDVKVYSLSRRAEVNSVHIPTGASQISFARSDPDVVLILDDNGLVRRWRWRTNELEQVLPEAECKSSSIASELRSCLSKGTGRYSLGLIDNKSIITFFDGQNYIGLDDQAAMAVVEVDKVQTFYPTFASLDELISDARRRLDPLGAILATRERG